MVLIHTTASVSQDMSVSNLLRLYSNNDDDDVDDDDDENCLYIALYKVMCTSKCMMLNNIGIYYGK